MTNRKGSKGLTQMLTTFLTREARHEPKHEYHFRPESSPSISVTLEG